MAVFHTEPSTFFKGRGMSSILVTSAVVIVVALLCVKVSIFLKKHSRDREAMLPQSIRLALYRKLRAKLEYMPYMVFLEYDNSHPKNVHSVFIIEYPGLKPCGPAVPALVSLFVTQISGERASEIEFYENEKHICSFQADSKGIEAAVNRSVGVVVGYVPEVI